MSASLNGENKAKVQSSGPSVAVIGAGAAGLMAAFWAARSGARTTLIERRKDGGRKILISGGGRCNVLPSRLDPRDFFTESSKNMMKRMLLDWPLAEQRAFFDEELELDLQLEEVSGKLFPACNSARVVRDTLRDSVEGEGASFRGDRTLVALRQSTKGWELAFADGGKLEVERVILATGGLSVPLTGSDGIGLRLCEELGLEMNPTYAALTPLLGGDKAVHALSGLSLHAELRAGESKKARRAEGGFLFTHGGFSGPTVLDLSDLAVRALDEGRPLPELRVRWLGSRAPDWEGLMGAGGRATTRSLLRRELPHRLADFLISWAQVQPDRKLAELPRDDRKRLLEALTGWPLPINGHEGYKKAEVTGGGVELGEVDPRDLQCRRFPGLYLCGEILDAFGPIGGYNFAWAWATGRRAGIGAAQVPASA